jgi:hypothetical protein
LEQERDRFGGHRAAVGVDGELVTDDVLLGAGLADEHPGEDGGLDSRLATIQRTAYRKRMSKITYTW